jgi:hypothetical protein
MELTLLKLNTAAMVARAREEEKEKRVAEAVSPELFSLLAGDAEDAKFRRITSPATMRDLNPLMHERMQQVCFFLAVTTPFGKRIIRLLTDYVVGEGFQVIANEAELQVVVDRFWEDSVNDMAQNCDSWFSELMTFGEICLPVAVNPIDGFTRVAWIDPQKIEAVEYSLMQTGNGQEVTVPIAVRLRRGIGESEGRRLEIIHQDEDVNSPTFGQQKGDCFYFAINKVKAASRGISELFALADWIDVFDNMIFDFADRVRLLNSFVWHYIVKGADDAMVEKIRDKVVKSPPRQGGVEVTNDQISIEARTPDLKGADMVDTDRVVKNYGLAGAGFPPWFFADAGNTNRATADEMAGPTGKMLTNRQNVLRRIVTQVMDYVIAQAVAHGVLSLSMDLGWNLQVPDLRMKDMAQAATALQTLANAAGIAEDRGWIRAETAARAFHTVLTQIGVEVESGEFDAAQADKTKRDAKQQDNLDPQANLAAALDAKKNPRALADARPATDAVQ